MSIADKLSEVKIRRLPLRQPAMVERGASIREAVEAMKASRLGCALVCEQGKLVGLFTERDLLNKVAGREADLDTLPVGEVMTKRPETIGERDPIRVVINKMAVGEYRHVPIVRDGRPVGIISAKAVANYILKHSGLDF